MNDNAVDRDEQPVPGQERRAETGGPPPPPPGYEHQNGRRGRWAQQAEAALDPRRKNVPLACVLSLMPGLGQIYVGYYQRGFVHVVTVGAIIAFLASWDNFNPLIPFMGFFLAFFWLYNIIDAGRRASLYNQALAGRAAMELPGDFEMPGTGGSVFGGAVLIGLGFLLLLHTRFDYSLEWIAEWWPMAPILLGAVLVWKGMQKKAS